MSAEYFLYQSPFRTAVRARLTMSHYYCILDSGKLFFVFVCTQSVSNATDSLDVSVKTVLEVIGLADVDDELRGAGNSSDFQTVGTFSNHSGIFSSLGEFFLALGHN